MVHMVETKIQTKMHEHSGVALLSLFPNHKTSSVSTSGEGGCSSTGAFCESIFKVLILLYIQISVIISGVFTFHSGIRPLSNKCNVSLKILSLFKKKNKENGLRPTHPFVKAVCH